MNLSFTILMETKINAIILILDTINEEIRKLKQVINKSDTSSNGQTEINLNKIEYFKQRKLINETKLKSYEKTN